MAPSPKVFPALFFLTSACYINRLVSLVSGSCEAVESCRAKISNPLTDQPNLEVILHYDSGNSPDTSYVKVMCKARTLLKKVKFTFIPGVKVEKSSTGELKCPIGDCYYSLVDGCALTFAADFTEFVCVEHDESMETMFDVYDKLHLDWNQFNECTTSPFEKTKPADKLLKNAQNAIAAHPNDKCTPYMSFNGKSDACARAIFVEDPLKVLCAMLASGLEEECAK